MSKLLEKYHSLHTESLLLAYIGSANNNMVSAVLQLAEYKLEKDERDIKVKKRVFSIVLELLQNVYHHSSTRTKGNCSPFCVFLVLGKDDSGYDIHVGNHLPSEEVREFQINVALANEQAEGDLRELIRDRLEVGPFTRKGGAGLGVMEIIRKSGNKMDYDLIEINEKVSFITLHTRVTY